MTPLVRRLDSVQFFDIRLKEIMNWRPPRLICDDGSNCRSRDNQENQEKENLSHPAWPSENANKVDDESNWINKQIANNY